MYALVFAAGCVHHPQLVEPTDAFPSVAARLCVDATELHAALSDMRTDPLVGQDVTNRLQADLVALDSFRSSSFRATLSDARLRGLDLFVARADAYGLSLAAFEPVWTRAGALEALREACDAVATDWSRSGGA